MSAIDPKENFLDSQEEEKMTKRTFFLLPRQIKQLKKISDVETKQSQHVRQALDQYFRGLENEKIN
ncbi:hypothetical protein ABHN11_24395 [Brevibacillus centrosporus]|uniref:hypothetical protein n=1 Tax=Brevibacillus centrosporus TaxID=54910 RepID=UPI003D19C0C4